MKIKLIIILILNIVVSCKKSDCKLSRIKTLYTDGYNKKEGYGHNVLINDYDRDCLDSLEFVNLAKKYIDTVKYDKPVTVIQFYFNDKDFIPNEKSQVLDEINKSCLVTIGFDKLNNKPNDFIFYNDNGEIIYWGERWEPNGIEGDNWPIH